MIKLYIFSLPTCAPCKVLKKQLTDNEEWVKEKNLKIEYLDMSETSDHVLDLATKFAIRSVPTIVALNQDGFAVKESTFEGMKNLVNSGVLGE